MTEVVNPYIAGSPITGTEMFFGREDVFEFVKRTLSGQHRDNVIVLYGQRRTGKTSVLYHIRRHLDPTYICVFVDLHALALEGVSGLLWDLASYVVRVLHRDYGIDVQRPDRAEFMTDARDHFRNEFLSSVRTAIGNRRVLLMLDEVGRLHEKVRDGGLEADVFEYLRHLMQHYDWLDFLYSLGSSLEEMKKEYSLLFSVGLYKRVSFLSRDAATELISKPCRNQYKVEDAAINRILDITSGHPYYTQLLCHCLFSRWQQHPSDFICARDVEEVLDLAIELGSANLKFVWSESSSAEKVIMAGLAACAGEESRIQDVRSAWEALDVELPETENARAIQSLIARDIVAGDEHYRFVVDLQRRWVRQQRRLSWVKDEISTDTPAWRSAVAEEKEIRSPAATRAFRRRIAMIVLTLSLVSSVMVAGRYLLRKAPATNSAPSEGKAPATKSAPSPPGVGVVQEKTLLINREGRVLANAQVFSLFWGAGWTHSPASELVPKINKFFGDIMSSELIDQLDEYQPGKQSSRGRFVGTTTIRKPITSSVITDDQIQRLLQQEIDSDIDGIPLPGSAVYFVFLPPGVRVTLGGSESCQAFCSYHDDISGRIYYAVVPYPDCTACAGSLKPFDALTVFISHSLYEAITDPIPGYSWLFPDGEEVADRCAWKTKQLGTYTVQLEWSNKVGACI